MLQPYWKNRPMRKPSDQAMDDKRCELLRKFVQAISDRDSSTLQEDFGLTSVMILEIYELLPVYFLEGAAISIPLPTYGAADDLIPLMTTYDRGDGDSAVECYLLEDGEPSEAILHVHFEKGNLIYGFINS
ncbi:hypothetical protein ABE509_16325 [[Pseudomonas] hibiscicola]|uniref:hypothetical protein n=1 Tax=Stenotrophomonas hibiscicola TaxID=86189 RepID=UPI00320B34C0